MQSVVATTAAAAAAAASSAGHRSVAVLDFWFGSEWAAGRPRKNYALWFGGTVEIDNQIRDLFATDVELAIAGKYDDWMGAKESALALILVLDQFALNIFRDQPKSYDTSALAIPLAYRAVAAKYNTSVPEDMRMFFHLPLMHSEVLADQERCVELCRAPDGTDDSFAVEHRDIVKKYGRFPGRNAVYGRKNTPEEEQYLKDGGVF